jgi:GDP-4-dehydro-6-deoxy-D-mannose reductase
VRAVVTGASGFVGQFLLAALREAGNEAVAFTGDVLDAGALCGALCDAAPDAVFHLAAVTFVPEAMANPAATYDVNIRGTANVAHAVREYAQKHVRRVRLLFTSSAEVYGVQPADAYPLAETATPAPANPYAASKAAAEALLLGEARSLGLDVVIARAFNHIGPGQNERFVVASFAAQLAAIARGAAPQLYVGNLEARRDFLDVRDVVRAYIALAEHGETAEIYNVCSGRAYAIRDALRELIIAAHVPVEVREDPERMRPSEVPLFVGDATKLRMRTGWEPRVPFAASIRDIYRAAANS